MSDRCRNKINRKFYSPLNCKQTNYFTMRHGISRNSGRTGITSTFFGLAELFHIMFSWNCLWEILTEENMQPSIWRKCYATADGMKVSVCWSEIKSANWTCWRLHTVVWWVPYSVWKKLNLVSKSQQYNQFDLWIVSALLCQTQVVLCYLRYAYSWLRRWLLRATLWQHTGALRAT